VNNLKGNKNIGKEHTPLDDEREYKCWHGAHSIGWREGKQCWQGAHTIGWREGIQMLTRNTHHWMTRGNNNVQ
jgi:hypothetical protein